MSTFTQLWADFLVGEAKKIAISPVSESLVIDGARKFVRPGIQENARVHQFVPALSSRTTPAPVGPSKAFEPTEDLRYLTVGPRCCLCEIPCLQFADV